MVNMALMGGKKNKNMIEEMVPEWLVGGWVKDGAGGEKRGCQ